MSNFKQKIFKFIVYIGIFFIFLIFLEITNLMPFFIALTVGWFSYIIKITQMQINIELIAQSIVCFIFVIIGTHYFCSWIYQHKNTNKLWQKSWSLSLVFLVLLSCTIGTVVTGMITQFGWLANEEKYSNYSMRGINGYEKDTLFPFDADNYEGSFSKLLLYFYLRSQNTYDYVYFISPENNIKAVIRFPLPSLKLFPEFMHIDVKVKHLDEYHNFKYNKLSVKEIIHNLEQGIIPQEND